MLAAEREGGGWPRGPSVGTGLEDPLWWLVEGTQCGGLAEGTQFGRLDENSQCWGLTKGTSWGGLAEKTQSGRPTEGTQYGKLAELT